MSISSLLKKITEVNPWKTLYFNFHYFPFRTAIHLPVFIYWRTKIHKMRGSITIDSPISIGMIRIGPHGIGTQDMLFSRTIWELNGNLTFKGDASIGRGSKISVGKEAKLTLGKRFIITGRTEIVCHKEISFGNDCLLSWDILVMDTDFHRIFNKLGEITNPSRSINIGNHVWIGCRATILKGVSIANNCVISANSTITKDILQENCVIGGNGKNTFTIKEEVNWEH